MDPYQVDSVPHQTHDKGPVSGCVIDVTHAFSQASRLRGGTSGGIHPMPGVPGSTRWPTQCTSTQNMKVYMEHRLPTVGIAVDDRSITVLRTSELPCHLGSREKHRPQDLAVFGICIVQRCNMLFGDNQCMPRSLRIQVLESQDKIGLQEDPCRDFSSHYSAENAIGHTSPPNQVIHDSGYRLRQLPPSQDIHGAHPSSRRPENA